MLMKAYNHLQGFVNEQAQQVITARNNYLFETLRVILFKAETEGIWSRHIMSVPVVASWGQQYTCVSSAIPETLIRLDIRVC